LKRSRHTIQVDAVNFLEEIGALVGVLPVISKHPRIWKELLFGPILPFQYRLDGPGTWVGAEDALVEVNKQLKYGKADHEAAAMWMEDETTTHS
jgi:dimethylaniline monooxygenase (N-oxide forming)